MKNVEHFDTNFRNSCPNVSSATRDVTCALICLNSFEQNLAEASILNKRDFLSWKMMDDIVCVFYVIPVETDALRLYLTDKALFFFRVPVVNNLIMQRDCVFFFLAELEAHLSLRLLI